MEDVKIMADEAVKLYAEGQYLQAREKAAAVLALDENNAKALNITALCYENGYGVEQDYKKAVKCYRQSIDHCKETHSHMYNEVLFNLGKCYEYGKGVAQDYISAAMLYIEAKGWSSSQSDIYAQAIHDYIECLKKAAEQDDHLAQYLLAECYRCGEYIERDYDKALRLYIKAAPYTKAHIRLDWEAQYIIKEGSDEHRYLMAEAYRLGCMFDDSHNPYYDKAIEAYSLVAEKDGYVMAQYYLGLLYYEGKTGIAKHQRDYNPERDNALAVKLFTKAAESGCAEAECGLGNCYFNGKGVEKDYEKAAELYSKAAEKGIVEAQYQLGVCYSNGYGVAEDQSKAVQLFAKAAQQGYSDAQYSLAAYYENGTAVTQDVDKAIELYKIAADQDNKKAQEALVTFYTKKAEQGDVQAQYELGMCYSNGYGVAKDQSKAAQLFEKAAQQGNVAAIYALGEFYHFQEKNYPKALELYNSAIEKGNTDAMCRLAGCFEGSYLNCCGVEKDYAKAIELYTKAKDLGCLDAYCRLADFYKYGYGVEKDYAKAIELYTKAKDLGYLDAYFCLADFYKYGYGVEKDQDMAFQLISEAARQNYPQAIYKIGHCYFYGIGVVKNEKEGLAWYIKAAEHGCKDAALALGDYYEENGRNISRAGYWFSVADAGYRIHDMMSHIRYC